MKEGVLNLVCSGNKVILTDSHSCMLIHSKYVRFE